MTRAPTGSCRGAGIGPIANPCPRASFNPIWTAAGVQQTTSRWGKCEIHTLSQWHTAAQTMCGTAAATKLLRTIDRNRTAQEAPHEAQERSAKRLALREGHDPTIRSCYSSQPAIEPFQSLVQSRSVGPNERASSVPSRFICNHYARQGWQHQQPPTNQPTNHHDSNDQQYREHRRPNAHKSRDEISDAVAIAGDGSVERKQGRGDQPMIYYLSISFRGTNPTPGRRCLSKTHAS